MNDLRSGNETHLYSNGAKYEGQWLDDKYDGFGKLTYARDDNLDRDYYSGEYKDDKKH